MNVFHFSNIVIEVDVLSTGKGSANVSEKTNTHNNKTREKKNNRRNSTEKKATTPFHRRSFVSFLGVSFVRQFNIYLLRGMLKTYKKVKIKKKYIKNKIRKKKKMCRMKTEGTK